MKKREVQNTVPNLKTIIIVVVVIIIMGTLFSVFRNFTNNLVNDITKTISQQYSQELNAQMSSHISSTMDNYFEDLRMMYNTLSLVEDLDEEKLENFIERIQKNEDISYFAFADDEGNVYEANGSYLGTMRISILGKLLNGAKHVVSDNETIDNESYIVLGTSFIEPIKMGDKNICIAIFGITNDDLEEKIILHSHYSGGYSSIIHTDGRYIVKNPSEKSGGLNVFAILDKRYQITDEELQNLKQKVKENESVLINAKQTEIGNSEYLYFAPIEGTEWYAVNTLPGEFIRGNIVELKNELSVASIVLIFFFIIVAAIVVLLQHSSRQKLRKSQIELAEALRNAEEASAAKTSFLFNMSHDIRTPMNAILGYTDIGLKNVDDLKISEDSYNKIKNAGSHLLNLINDILEMSRIESGKLELSEMPIDIRKAVEGVTNMSIALADSKKIDFATVIGEIKNPYVYADELHINEVIINLISNAVKYTPEGGCVRYTVNQISDIVDEKVMYRFEVADNGIGMSEEFQKHLFEAFSRESTATVSKIEGAGLGLSIVKRITELAGGEISVKSKSNEGSIFTVEIPFKIMDDAAIEAFRAENYTDSENVEDNISLEGKKVLLVEDNELNREIAMYLLEDSGLEVETAEDGEIALRAVEEKGVDYYDVILMDIQMPVMDGYEATKAIRKLPDGYNVPIIALSANAFEEDKQKSLSIGMNAHIAKPIDAKELLETMNNLMK